MNHSVGKSVMINLQNDAESNVRRSIYCSDMSRLTRGITLPTLESFICNPPGMQRFTGLNFKNLYKNIYSHVNKQSVLPSSWAPTEEMAD